MLEIVAESEKEDSAVKTPRKLHGDYTGASGKNSENSIVPEEEMMESAAVYLNELIGNIPEAVRLYILEIEEAMNSILSEIYSMERRVCINFQFFLIFQPPPFNYPYYKTEKFDFLINKCIRAIRNNTTLFTEQEGHAMWFNVFTCVGNYLKRLKQGKRSTEGSSQNLPKY